MSSALCVYNKVFLCNDVPPKRCKKRGGSKSTNTFAVTYDLLMSLRCDMWHEAIYKSPSYYGKKVEIFDKEIAEKILDIKYSWIQ